MAELLPLDFPSYEYEVDCKTAGKRTWRITISAKMSSPSIHPSRVMSTTWNQLASRCRQFSSQCYAMWGHSKWLFKMNQCARFVDTSTYSIAIRTMRVPLWFLWPSQSALYLHQYFIYIGMWGEQWQIWIFLFVVLWSHNHPKRNTQ